MLWLFHEQWDQPKNSDTSFNADALLNKCTLRLRLSHICWDVTNLEDTGNESERGLEGKVIGMYQILVYSDHFFLI